MCIIPENSKRKIANRWRSRGLIFIVYFFVFLPPFLLTAQHKFTLEVKSIDNEDVLKKYFPKKEFVTALERKRELNSILQHLHENSYLAASVDSMQTDSMKLIAYFFIGEKYVWAYLRKGNVDEEMLAGFREKIYNNKPFKIKEVSKLHEKIIASCENSGYPFAAINFDSVKVEKDKISARLTLSKGNLVIIDSILVRGNAKISAVYLSNYLGIKDGSLYNESQIRKISNRLRELPFVRESKAFYITFNEKQAKLHLFLEKKKSSQFDGIVGFLPDNVTGRILFTGDVHLKLQNAVGRGELLDFNWRSLQKNTQDLKMKFLYPYLLSTPIGFDYDFKLYKKDTTYIDVANRVGLQYLFSGLNYLRVYYNNKTSDLLSTKGLEFISSLPPYADTKVSGYGMAISLENLDYRFNPRKGYAVNVNVNAGNKRIKRNAKINPAVYRGIDDNMMQYSAEAELNLFIPLAKRAAIKIGNQSGCIDAPTLFQNDLYRIGGLKNLRGFDEESIYVSLYTVSTIEIRYLLEQNSYFYLFGDWAYYENHSANFSGDRYDTPFGFGTGISFETKAGIFSLSYALGKQFNNPILIRSGKIHFGIVSYF